VLRNNFSVAFNTYIDILASVEKRVNVVLGRDAPDWRLKNACPPCMYILEDEPPSEFSMLAAIDGNNSLKRIERGTRDKDPTGKTIVTASTELPDSCTLRLDSDMYLSEAEVDRFKDEVKHRLPCADASVSVPSLTE
jgi:hypothetical protein